jgi:hypothetical protein
MAGPDGYLGVDARQQPLSREQEFPRASAPEKGVQPTEGWQCLIDDGTSSLEGSGEIVG